MITYPVDVADMAGCDWFVQPLIACHGGVDIFVDNAGRSIRRDIESRYDHFHIVRCAMQLNYFGALRRIDVCVSPPGWAYSAKSFMRCCLASHGSRTDRARIVMNTSFRMFPGSEAAKSIGRNGMQMSAGQIALQQLLKGVHV